jgi:hypothetical protein
VCLTRLSWNKKLRRKIRRIFRRQPVLLHAKGEARCRLQAQVLPARIVVRQVRLLPAAEPAVWRLVEQQLLR